MQNTSALYNELIAKDNHWFEVALAIGESGRLITERNDVILFGNTAILVDTGGASTAFREDILMSLSTKHAVFNENYPTVGGAVSGEIDISMIKPTADIPITTTRGTIHTQIERGAITAVIPSTAQYPDHPAVVRMVLIVISRNREIRGS